eukprot:5933580-Lingulodinium_polyedra.AAC.1
MGSRALARCRAREWAIASTNTLRASECKRGSANIVPKAAVAPLAALARAAISRPCKRLAAALEP